MPTVWRSLPTAAGSMNMASRHLDGVHKAPAPYHLEYVDVLDKLCVSSRREPKIRVIDLELMVVKYAIDLLTRCGIPDGYWS